MCFASWKINETCLLCFVVRASRSNLLSSSLVSTLCLCLLVIVGWAKLGLSQSTIPLYLSFISFNSLRSFVKYCLNYSKINFYVFEPPCHKFEATRSSCAEFSCLMNNRWEREISGYKVFGERAPRSNPPSSILVLKLWLSVFTSNCRLNEIRALKVNCTFFPAFNCQFL